MEIKNYSEQYKKGIYDLYCDFQKEEDFYQVMTFEKFDKFLFQNPSFQNEGSFVAVEGKNVIGFAGSLVRKADEGNPKASGYIHTFIVKKEYRRQGIGSKLLKLCEEYIKNCNRTSVRLVFLSPINWPWYIPHTDHHEHPGLPGVVMNSEFYIFLYHHSYFVNSIHEGFHLPLSEYELPEKVKYQIEENKKRGLTVEIYDPTRHIGVEDFCKKLDTDNPGFASAIRSNLAKEKPNPFLVALENNRVVGWTGAMYNEPSGRGHLDGICVDKDIRGAGLGKTLFCMLCYESKNNGAQYMTFFTGIDNPARYIYLHAGFKIAKSFADMKKNLE